MASVRGLFRDSENDSGLQMAASCQTLARRADALALNRCLHLRWRRTHTQSLWEELLGRKIEAAAAKKLEEAFLEYRVRKAVPSWLPFLPNSSFWIPSTEETIKNLEVLAERMKLARPARKERVHIYKAPPDWSESGSVSTVAAWSVIQQTDRLLSSVNSNGVPSVDALLKSSVEKGTVIEVEIEDEDLDEDDDDAEEEDSEADEKQKPEGS